MNAYVKIEIENGIGFIEFFHPQSNSLPGNILDQLAETITKTASDDKIQVVVLQSGGDRTFCAGASFNELQAIKNETQGKQFFFWFCQCH